MTMPTSTEAPQGIRSSRWRHSEKARNYSQSSLNSALPRVSIIACIRGSGSSCPSERVLFPHHLSASDREQLSVTEIIIVDASPDKVSCDAIRDAVDSFGGIYVRDELPSQQYRLARARNLGAAAASGEFLLKRYACRSDRGSPFYLSGGV